MQRRVDVLATIRAQVHICPAGKGNPSAVCRVSDPFHVLFFRYTHMRAHTQPCTECLRTRQGDLGCGGCAPPCDPGTGTGPCDRSLGEGSRWRRCNSPASRSAAGYRTPGPAAHAGTQAAAQERKTPYLGPSCPISPQMHLLSMSSIKCKQR